MKDYVEVRGYCIKLTEILDTNNKRITELPTIPEFIENGCPIVYWAHILGRCAFDNCQFKRGYVPQSAIPNPFAKEVVTILTPGVNSVVAKYRDNDGLPTKRQRTEGGKPERQKGGHNSRK